jgi:predicted O-methyltransferase YrrM
MTAILDEILTSGVVKDEAGVEHAMHSNTSAGQCAFLRGLIQSIDARHCLEVGLAYGISSLAICESIHRKPDASLVSIDPFQRAHWRDIGLLNLARGGYTSIVEFHARPSHEVLPELLLNGRTLDFAYVDTVKIFDVVLIDAFFIIRLLKPGGIVVFDDVSWPGIRKLVRYLASWPHLEVCGTHGGGGPRVVNRLGSMLSRFIPFRNRICRSELLRTDEELGVDAPCVAFRKIRDDERPWDWSLLP